MSGNIEGLETQHQITRIGIEAIRFAYQSMTSKIKLDVSLLIGTCQIPMYPIIGVGSLIFKGGGGGGSNVT